MIIRAAKRYHVSLDMNPSDISALIGELELSAREGRDRPQIHQLLVTLQSVCETDDLDITGGDNK